MGMTGPSRQKGVALIVVLMIFAMVFTLAVEIMRRQEAFITRTRNLINWSRSHQYAMAAETVAIQALLDDLKADRRADKMVDTCQERWAVRIPPTPYEDAILSATVQDLQGQFNLNWLVNLKGDRFVRDKQARKALARLLTDLLEKPALARKLSFQMADWIDSNSLVDGVYGAEDAAYRHRRTPNVPVAHESEFRALLSMSAEVLPGNGVLFDYLVALPVDTQLNLNTASLLVLEAVLGRYGDHAAEAVRDLRSDGPITDVSALFGVAPFNDLSKEQREAIRQRVGVRSHYFQVMIDVKLDGQRTRLITRIYRGPDAGGDSGPGAYVISRQQVPVLEPLEPPCNPHYNAANAGREGT